LNRLSHLLFGFSLFVGIYSLAYAYTVWLSDIATLMDLLYYYLAGGIVFSVISVPILYYKAPHKDDAHRTTSNRGAIGAMSFVTFCVGSLGGIFVYQYTTGVTVIGNISIFIGAIITMAGAIMPDWDIIFLDISRHRNIIFHSVILPLLITLITLFNVAQNLVSGGVFSAGAHIEYYITALFLLGYASHLYLDIFPSDASPIEIIWRAFDLDKKAPTGLKPLGPIKIGKKGARAWLVGNATILVLVALGLMGLYFYQISLLSP
jgi:hypothetical protein